MSLRGQCVICCSAFTSTTVFALPCGHTFHEPCIGAWLKTPDRGCPTCRRKCQAKDVTRIFFDDGSLNDTLNVTTQENGEEALRAKNEDLQARLHHVTAQASKAKKDLSVQTEKLEALKNLVATERKRATQATQELELKKAQFSQFYKDSNATRLTSMLLEERKKCRKMAEELQVKNKRISELGIGAKQDYLYCMCQGECTTKRCTCQKNNVPCNSRCHSSKSCANKSCSGHDDRPLTPNARRSLPFALTHPALIQPTAGDLKAKRRSVAQH